MKTKTYKIRGVNQCLMHNGQSVDPTNKFAIALKSFSAKRKKSLEDYVKMSQVEMSSGLYMIADEKTNQNRPGFPAINVDAMLVSAGKKLKLGTVVKSGVFSKDLVLEYEGPKTYQELLENMDKFSIRARACVGQGSSIIRTRPAFDKWSANLTIEFDDTVLDEEQLTQIVEIAGKLIGLGDWRPRYGRFEVLK